jgi:SAM-dependent methyltransferase
MTTTAYDAEMYDALHAGRAADVDYYTALARESGGPVLELGAGTGRILRAIAAAGVDVVGVDSSPEMIERLRIHLSSDDVATRSRVRVVEGDMTRFRLGERFALVIAPFRGFLHNVTREEQLACLQRCHEHLRPGGLLALDVFLPSLPIMAASHGSMEGLWRWTDSFELSEGRAVTFSEATVYAPEAQRLTTSHRYDVRGPDGTLVRSLIQVLELAYVYPGDMRDLLATTGYRDINLEGGFDGSPIDESSSEIVVRARRPAADE